MGELPALRLLIRKGFHHANPGQGILHLGVDIPDPLPVAAQGDVDPAVEIGRIQEHHRQEEEHGDGQRGVDLEQDEEGADEFHRIDNKIFRSVMIQLGKQEQVIRDPRHELSCALLVVEAQGQFLIMVEQLAAQVAFHHGAQGVAAVGHVEVAGCMHQHQQKHEGANLQDTLGGIQGVPFQDGLRNIAGAQGQDERDPGDDQGAGHHREEQLCIGFVVREELLRARIHNDSISIRLKEKPRP